MSNRKAVRAWVLYDWANSAYATTIMAAIMPIFYADVAGKGLDGATKTAYWGYTQSIALVFLVLLSPVLGAIADASHSKRAFLRFFTYMGVLSSILLFFVGEGNWLWASLLVILGTLAFSGGNIFYDAFLTDLVPEKERDRVSSRGYAYGYIGGGILLALNLAAIQFPEAFFSAELSRGHSAFLPVGGPLVVYLLHPLFPPCAGPGNLPQSEASPRRPRRFRDPFHLEYDPPVGTVSRIVEVFNRLLVFL